MSPKLRESQLTMLPVVKQTYESGISHPPKCQTMSFLLWTDTFWTTSIPVPVVLNSQWSGLPLKFSTTANTPASQTCGPSVRNWPPAAAAWWSSTATTTVGDVLAYVCRCGDVGDLLGGQDPVWKPLQPGSGERHHQRHPAVSAAPCLATAVRHDVPLLARGTQLSIICSSVIFRFFAHLKRFSQKKQMYVCILYLKRILTFTKYTHTNEEFDIITSWQDGALLLSLVYIWWLTVVNHFFFLFFCGFADSSRSAVVLRAAGGNQKSGRESGLMENKHIEASLCWRESARSVVYCCKYVTCVFLN